MRVQHHDPEIASTRRGRRTAARLRGAARDVFAEMGYVRARVDDICDRAEVSHGTFYVYFDNKADILAALVTAAAERLQAVAEAPWTSPDNEEGEGGNLAVRAVLERVIGDFLRVYLEEAPVARAWVEAAAIDADFASRLTELRSDFIERVAANLAPAAEAGGHHPEAAASALVAMVQGYVLEYGEQVRESPGQAARTLAALWYGGLEGLADQEDSHPRKRRPPRTGAAGVGGPDAGG